MAMCRITGPLRVDVEYIAVNQLPSSSLFRVKIGFQEPISVQVEPFLGLFTTPGGEI